MNRGLAIARSFGHEAKKLVPRALARRLSLLRTRFGPVPIGSVQFGDFRRVSPISKSAGWDRGTPIDRYYLEAFLSQNSGDIRGRVLEVADDRYTRRFGTAVTQSDVLDVDARNARATFIGDLADPGVLPESAFDCIVFTQTLQYIYDLRAGIGNLSRALMPGGVLLLSTGGLTPLSLFYEAKMYWWLTPVAVLRLLEEHFEPQSVQVKAFGNVFAVSAFLYGLAAEELDREDLDVEDPRYPVVVVARAVKRAG